MARQKLTIKELNKRVRFLEQVEIYKPITLLKKAGGFALIGYGVATLWNPISGSIWTIMGGCALLGIDYKILLNTIKFYGKKILDWAYGNRNLKLIKYNMKARFLK